MPYIKRDRRELVESQGPVTAGDLNYIFTMIIQDYLPCPARYDDYNEVVGVLECCKQELYRRMVVPYEDKKIIENGDVYDGFEQQAAETGKAAELSSQRTS